MDGTATVEIDRPGKVQGILGQMVVHRLYNMALCSAQSFANSPRTRSTKTEIYSIRNQQ
jgi:hypothetical protein